VAAESPESVTPNTTVIGHRFSYFSGPTRNKSGPDVLSELCLERNGWRTLARISLLRCWAILMTDGRPQAGAGQDRREERADRQLKASQEVQPILSWLACRREQPASFIPKNNVRLLCMYEFRFKVEVRCRQATCDHGWQSIGELCWLLNGLFLEKASALCTLKVCLQEWRGTNEFAWGERGDE
jgi:hypothetical protein